MERGIGSESSRFGEGSPTVHNRIAESIHGSPWIGSGSKREAKREHPWIVRFRKIVKDQPRYRCRRPYDVDESHSFMEVAVGQSELNNHIERSGVDPLTPVMVLVNPIQLMVTCIWARLLLRRSGLSADEVSVWLGELLQLSRTKKRYETERKRVEELCQLLRGAAYTNKWLEDYTERARIKYKIRKSRSLNPSRLKTPSTSATDLRWGLRSPCVPLTPPPEIARSARALSE